MTMSPGTYLARRRAAAGLEVEDVALRIETTPYPMNLRDRVAWLRNIEQDVSPLTIGTAVALQQLYPFDGEVLIQLCVCIDNPQKAPPAICRVCACTQHDACRDGDMTCGWAEDDLCTRCAEELRFATAHHGALATTAGSAAA
ncbi:MULTISPECIES: XRE family transcriptional regulator [Sphingobium]|uniref:XRE family transcriptional regulator n=1 Tax=Sphingobium TaxID=165695 RepID=UPI0015EC2462|nr:MULTISPECIES: XRE family transcriptional regulator [Sphingobium]MCW2361645.1 hypothetical protein [Sphingobium sp. B10D3B]MCW2401676.1 hypothetical protein [Sphingobium sp. B10D7B]MCW2408656.1 hypothetical protein [Sphingobium xanthum]